jgi:hypothetical protein
MSDMGTRRTLATAATAALGALALTLGITGSLGFSGSAAATDTTMIVGATLAVDKTTLSGLDLAVMTVTVHLKDDSGVRPNNGCPCAGLQAVDATGTETSVDPEATNNRYVQLSLLSGSLKDGFWSGRTSVGAINAGDWQLTGLNAGSINDYSKDQRGLAIVPGKAFGAEVSFTGSHWPELTLAIPQTPVTYPATYVATGTAYWSDTRQPIPGLRLSWEPGARAQQYQATPPAYVTTDAEGKFAHIDNQPAFTAAIVFAPEQSQPAWTSWVSEAVATGRTERYHVTLLHHGRHMSVCLSPNIAMDEENATIQWWTGATWRAVSSWDVLNSCENGYVTVTHVGRYRATFPTDKDAEIAGNTSAVVTVTS